MSESAAGPGLSTLPRILRFGRLYFFLVGLPIAGIIMIVSLGGRWHPAVSPPAVGVPALGAASASTGWSALLLLLSQVALILSVSRILGRVLARLGQPRVIGEMAAGILLGPSFFGTLSPGVSALIFPAASLGYLNSLSQIGVILFMFVVGMELDPDILRGRTDAAVLTSHASITAPFLLGTAAALLLYPGLAGPGVGFAQFSLFLGAAMSVTAFPVLARILTERRLVGTRLGSVAIICAAVGDVTAWCILAAVAALIRTSSVAHPLWLTVGGALLFAALVLTVGRRLFAVLELRFERRGHVSSDMTAVMIVSALAGAWVTEWLGVHALFGAFLVGVAMPKHPALVRALLDRFEDVLTVLFLPLFFAFTGLRTRIGLISGAEMWLICAGIIAVAIVGKLGGSALASRLSGMDWRESVAVGILMNTRGLIELVFLNVGLELGVISPALFAMMVLMALATTVMTSPLLAAVWPAARRAAPA